MSETIPFEKVKQANADAGFYFFDPGASRFFHSRYPRTAIRGEGGTWFYTSEQREPYARDWGYGLQPATRRFYNVRRLEPDGTITTIADRYGCLSYVDTRAHAAKLATMLADGIACLPSQWVGSASE
jgi:hypothetical protein